MKMSFVSVDKNKTHNMGHYFCKTPDRYYLSVVLLSLFIFPLYLIAVGRLGLKPLLLLVVISLTGFIIEKGGSIITKKRQTYYGIMSWIIFPLLIPGYSDLDGSYMFRSEFDYMPSTIWRIWKSPFQFCSSRPSIPIDQFCEAL